MIRAPKFALFFTGSLLVMSFATCTDLYKYMYPDGLPPVHLQAQTEAAQSQTAKANI